MCIHDLRNPTSAIKLGLEETIVNIKDIETIFEDQEKFIDIETNFNSKIRENIDIFSKISY